MTVRSESTSGAGAGADSVPDKAAKAERSEMHVVGKLCGVYGIKGWLKVQSYTEPKENLLDMNPCYLKTQQGWQAFEFDQGKIHGKGLIVHPLGCDDRNQAEQFARVELAVSVDAFTPLDEGDYYWYQLEDLDVWCVDASGKPEVLLGKVSTMLETGANDVLVVKGSPDSIDGRERLIPYRLDEVVKEVSLAESRILVDWDPDF